MEKLSVQQHKVEDALEKKNSVQSSEKVGMWK